MASRQNSKILLVNYEAGKPYRTKKLINPAQTAILSRVPPRDPGFVFKRAEEFYEYGHYLGMFSRASLLARHSRTTSRHGHACSASTAMLLFLFLLVCAGTSDRSQHWCSRAPAPNSSLPWALHADDAAKLSRQWGCNSSENFARQLLPSVVNELMRTSC